MSKNQTEQIKAMLNHHLESALAGDVDGVLSDYSEDSVMYMPQGPIRGLAQIRGFFTDFLGSRPEGFPHAFELLRMDVEGEIAYIVWRMKPSIPFATDTFIVRNGRFVVQTFAAYVPPAAA